MAHHYQKRWVFTWNANEDGSLPDCTKLRTFLDGIVVEGVFQRECGLKTGRQHYQGRFELKGSRLGKKRLLELFREVADVTQLTFAPEIAYDSTRYCTKAESRVEGPWFTGSNAYKQRNTLMELKMNDWQKTFHEELRKLDKSSKRDRYVIWIEDGVGGSGKTTFAKYLGFGQKEWNVKKLPFDKPDRIRHAVCKLVQKEDVDIFTFDFTRTRGEETSVSNLFQAVEEIKAGHVSSVMYGHPMEVAFPSPQIIIFTNEKFEDYRHYLSADRWQPYSISPSQKLAKQVWDTELNAWVNIEITETKK